MKSNFFLDGGSNENCGIAYPQLESWTDWICKITREVPLHCSCEKKGEVYLTMRGLCSNSNIDKYWTAQAKLGRFYLLGILSSQIDYDFQNKKWNLKVEKLKEVSITRIQELQMYCIISFYQNFFSISALRFLEENKIQTPFLKIHITHFCWGEIIGLSPMTQMVRLGY